MTMTETREHVHVWGSIESSRFGGTHHQKCVNGDCRDINAYADEDDLTIVTIAAELYEDGDTYDLDDGRTFRLSIEPDLIDPFAEFDCYGRIEPCDGPYDREGMRTNGRPRDFDGNAEKLWLQQNGPCVWWQPPTDVKRTDEGFAALRSNVYDVASFGMKSYALELLAPTEDADVLGHRPVLAIDSLCGIEPFADRAYVSSIVADLVAEVLS